MYWDPSAVKDYTFRIYSANDVEITTIRGEEAQTLANLNKI